MVNRHNFKLSYLLQINIGRTIIFRLSFQTLELIMKFSHFIRPHVELNAILFLLEIYFSFTQSIHAKRQFVDPRTWSNQVHSPCPKLYCIFPPCFAKSGSRWRQNKNKRCLLIFLHGIKFKIWPFEQLHRVHQKTQCFHPHQPPSS
jgi:hypothetical protein